MVERYFPQYALQDQEVLGRKESIDKVLALVPEDILFNGYYENSAFTFFYWIYWIFVLFWPVML